MGGGKLMDLFIDKLAQRINAQEMIKANAQAEAEETDKLKATVAGYKEALAKVANLAEESVSRLDSTKIDIEKVNELVDGSLEKYSQMEDLAGSIDGTIEEKTVEIEEEVHKECVKVYRNVQAVIVEETNKQSVELKDMIKENKKGINTAKWFSIAACVFALAAFTLQLLIYLEII